MFRVFVLFCFHVAEKQEKNHKGNQNHILVGCHLEWCNFVEDWSEQIIWRFLKAAHTCFNSFLISRIAFCMWLMTICDFSMSALCHSLFRTNFLRSMIVSFSSFSSSSFGRDVSFVSGANDIFQWVLMVYFWKSSSW